MLRLVPETCSRKPGPETWTAIKFRSSRKPGQPSNFGRWLFRRSVDLCIDPAANCPKGTIYRVRIGSTAAGWFCALRRVGRPRLWVWRVWALTTERDESRPCRTGSRGYLIALLETPWSKPSRTVGDILDWRCFNVVALAVLMWAGSARSAARTRRHCEVPVRPTPFFLN